MTGREKAGLRGPVHTVESRESSESSSRSTYAPDGR